MTKLAIVLSAALLATSAVAQEHLVPEQSVFPDYSADFGEYNSLVASAFKEAFDRNVLARVIAIPSFRREYAIWLKRTGNAYTVYFLEPTVQLWGHPSLKMLESGQEGILNKDGTSRRDEEGIARLKAELPADPRDVKFNRCEIRIEESLGDRLVRAWTAMLLQTHYDEVPTQIDADGTVLQTVTVHADGDTFHFSMPYADPLELEGYAWSPDTNSKTGKFVAITNTMKKLCEMKDRKLEQQLSRQADELLAQLPELKTIKRQSK